MKEVNRKAFQEALDSQKVIYKGRGRSKGKSRISEPYVCLMQKVASGYFNHEIMDRPDRVYEYIKKLHDVGVDFPAVRRSGVTALERRIITAIEKGCRTTEQIKCEINGDMELSSIKSHLVRLGRWYDLEGKIQDFKPKRRFLPQGYPVEVSGRTRDVQVSQNHDA